MKTSPKLLLPLALVALCVSANAAVPPSEKLLPKDTLLVVTVPDWAKAKPIWTNAPYSRLWQDPAFKPFRDKFTDKLTTDVLKPLEQHLGIKFSDFDGLPQGQVTFALIPVTPVNKSGDPLAGILLVDTRDHATQLKTNLAGIIKKWAAAGKPMKSQKIREVEFTTLMLSPDDLALKSVFPSAKPDQPSGSPDTNAADKNAEVTIGQSDSLLLISDSTEAIDKVLSRKAGGMVPALEESPAFQADFGARLRPAFCYVWLNARSLFDLILKAPPGADEEAAASALRTSTMLTSLGLTSFTSASLSYKGSPEGYEGQLFVAVPADKRPPLLNVLAADAKDSSPPPFVPADAVKFWRWRLNMSRSWSTLETSLNGLLPPMYTAGLNSFFAQAGKDKDEHYDLKAELLNNLGDDIISYQKAPKPHSLADLRSNPTLFLIGSPNPEKLASAIKVLLGVMYPAGIKDRDFLGRKIYTAASAAPTSSPAAAGQGVSFAASGSYVAISPDAAILEEFLRGRENNTKSLRDMPEWADAAQHVGGMSTGFLSLADDTRIMRPVFDMVRSQPLSMQDFLGTSLPVGAGAAQLETFRQWADFTLLPPFDTISKYFSISVCSVAFTPEGFSLRAFKPTPAQLRH
jgi:hypothetical protein